MSFYSSMKIRHAVVDDASEIKNLVSSLSHYYLADKDSSVLPEWFSATLATSEFEQRLSSENFSNFVYSVDNVIVGYISIKDKSHLYHLFVAENHQGKGISKALWSHATSDTGISVYTVRSSLFAVPIYKRFGFNESEPAAAKDGIGFQPMTLVRYT